MTIVVTGAAGFIGYSVSKALLNLGKKVVGVDNLNSYYDVSLKKERLKDLSESSFFHFNLVDITSLDGLKEIFSLHNPTRVIHLAAQAGVRYSIEDPLPYVQSNLVGFTNILECCRYQDNFESLVYASTSSVYGTNKDMPFPEHIRTDTPMSFYAATKKANEVMAQSYYHLYNLPVTGLRFFTVYGPWGRPDMALFKFSKAILKDQPIDVYNHGKMTRDLTYISDIVDGTLRASGKTQPSYDYGLHHPVYNLGNSHPESLMKIIEILEDSLGKKAIKNFLPLQPGDVPETASDVTKARNELGYFPKVKIEEGIPQFVKWYLSRYPQHSSKN